MKRRIYGACAFVFYLLAVCLALSGKIDNEMSTEVVIRPVEVTERYTDGIYILSPYCIYIVQDSTNTGYFAVYELVEGSDWQQGLRIADVPRSQFSIYTSNGSDYAEFTTTRSRTLVQDASRQPGEGQQAVIIEQSTAADQYLIVYPNVVPEYVDPAEGYTLAAKGESSTLLNAAESPTPFLEEQAHETLYRILTADAQIFSVRDIVTFFWCLPWAALAGVLLLLTLPLWGWIFLLLGSPGQLRRVLLAAVAIGALVGAAMLALGQFDLPSSLMPTDNIFSLSYYRQEFEMIFDALRQVDPSGESAVYAAVAFARRWSIACAVGGAAAFLLLSAAPLLVRKCRPEA